MAEREPSSARWSGPSSPSPPCPARPARSATRAVLRPARPSSRASCSAARCWASPSAAAPRAGSCAILRDDSIRSSHARRSFDVRLDRALHPESPESGEPRLPHDRYSPDRGVHPAICDRAVRGRLLAGATRAVRRRVGVSVHRPCVRGKAAGVFQGLALLVRGPAVVAGEAPGTRLGGGRSSGSLENPPALARDYHVTVHDVAYDPGNEAIAARFGDEPALPLQLVERRGERVAAHARRPP